MEEHQVDLTPMERKVAIQIAKGKTNAEIADHLFISQRRVGQLISSIKRKWQVHSRVLIGMMALHLGWATLAIHPRTVEVLEKKVHVR
ncbi:response regulator transcription factor [Salinithrix halophila]|uniref:Response regulator transcription factor n=1 Tax=Salinithrix halophila TaxID=1485204 RepID=A0ABV8JKP8_9BACL